MNEHLPSYFRWLALAALAEWLLARTVTRAAIHMPKTPAIAAGYTAVHQIGLVAAAFVGLLSLGLLLWAAWRSRRTPWLASIFISLGLMSVLFLFLIPPAWLALTYQLLAVTAVLVLCARGRGAQDGQEPEGQGAEEKQWQGTALLLPAAALVSGLLVQLLPNLYAAGGWPGPPPLTGALFNLGEIFVIGSALVWWWGYGRFASWRAWAVAAVPALLFALSFWRDPAMTGILTIWSTGLTLFLPWPFYVAALWLAGVTVLATWHSNPLLANAILLLAAAGYAPQLSSQLFCALIALWLLAQASPAVQPAWQQAGQAATRPGLQS